MRTEETKARLLEAIGKYGLCDASACDYAGLSVSTLYVWRKEDPKLLEDLTRARAEFKALHMANIIHHARTDARHSEWLLARLYPLEFAERSIVDTQDSGSPLDKLFGPADAVAASPEDEPEA